MELIFQGAEAKLFRTEHNGEKVLLKERIGKEYRNKELDRKIRKERTVLESNLLKKAKSLGINVPAIIEIDRENAKIFMEFIEGKRVKDILNKNNFSEICSEIGKTIGKIHSAGIVHGDLTTSNIMQRKKELVFIDFGLGFHSKKIEDKAVDLIVFKKTFEATHHSLMPCAWEIMLKSYAKENKEESEKVFKQMEAVEKRGRYH